MEQVRYSKIQPKTIVLSTKLQGITRVCEVYNPERRAEVPCALCKAEFEYIEICLLTTQPPYPKQKN